MSYEIAQPRIATARAHESLRLNLSGLGLTALPSEFGALRQLRANKNRLAPPPPAGRRA